MGTDTNQVLVNVVVPDRPEVKTLDARENRGGNLLRVGRAKHEDHVLRWLLESLEQRVERCRREHVNLVDDVHLVATLRRSVAHAVYDFLSNAVDARTRGGVELVHVWVLARRDELALITCAIGKMPGTLLAHERFGQKPRHSGLSRTARPTKQICVACAALENRPLQRSHHMLLTHHVVKGLWTIFSVERLHVDLRPSLTVGNSIAPR